jgi:glycosyltransferase involved in cell wall biosynthesis
MLDSARKTESALVPSGQSHVKSIVYLTSARIPSRAANAVQTVKMCDAFATNNCAVELFCRQGTEGPNDLFAAYRVNNRFRVNALSQRGVRGFHTAFFLRDVYKSVRGEVPDLFFARDVYSLALMARKESPLVFEAHRTLAAGSLEARVFRFLSRQSNFRKLITVTQAMLDCFRRQFQWLKPEQTLVLPNATDDMMSFGDNAGNGIGTWHEGRPGALQVGYVGHLYEGRGVETLVQAARGLPELDFHLVGGTESDVARWRAADIPSNVAIHGYVPYERVAKFYQRFDILTAPYAQRVYTAGGAETSAVMCPLKLYEYLSVGKPIVASDLPAVRTVVSPDVHALLVPPANAAAFADALRRLSRDEALRARLAMMARQRFLEQGTWHARATRLLNELKS